jgi:DNA polymerase elongation subunit (family B)
MEHIFRLYDFNVYNIKEQEQEEEAEQEECKEKIDINKFIIQMFGINETGESCSILVEDFKPFFYIKVSDKWTQYTKTLFLQHIIKIVGKYYEKSIISCKLLKRKKLYGFDGGKEHKFIMFQFTNMPVFNKVKNLWYINVNKENFRDNKLNPNGFIFADTKTEIYESNIPALLRFFHITNISPSGWVALPRKTTTVIKGKNKKTTCKYEFSASQKNIIPLNDCETRVPYKICSFDIEASSSHGDFPVPVKSYKKLATNIMEYIEQVQDLTPEKCTHILKNIILKAFGYNSDPTMILTTIDIVYPKVVPKSVEKMFESWISCKIENIEDLKINSQMTIENMFESMHTEEDTEDSYEHLVKTSSKKKEGTTNTIIDVLCNKKLARENKVILLNKTLSNDYDTCECSKNKYPFPALEGDKVTFIGSTFLKSGDTEPYLNHCIVLNTCEPLNNCITETYDTEKQVLLAWTDLIQRENPDIIIGYNIFGFDYAFMFNRAEQNGCVEAFLKLSKNKEEVCGNIDYLTKQYKLEETTIHIASGQHDLKYIKMNGRIQIDLYNYFRREENLSSYKLDYVAGHFIGDYIKAFTTIGPNTEIISTNLMGLLENSFVHFEEIGHSTDYYCDGAKFEVVTVNKIMSTFIVKGHVSPDMTKKVRWCLAKDDVTPKDIFRMTNGTAADRAIIAKYCIQDCNLVQHLMNKVDVLTGFIEMAKICSVPISFLILRGQGIKLTSYVAKKCREKRTLMPVIERSEDNDGYEGAIVLEPKCDLYLDNPVACVDYASLYPSSMMSENLSHDSKVWTREYNLSGVLIAEIGEINDIGEFIYDNLSGYEYVNITYDTFKYVRKTPSAAAEKIKSGHKICRFAQFPDGQRAIMPSILEELLTARKTTRKLIPTQTDEFMKNVLDKRQIGYKLTANSLYGQCGAKTSTFYDKDIAASTTATGRLLLTYAKRMIEEVYGNRVCDTKIGPVLTKAEYIYGDSVANYTPVYVSTFKGGIKDEMEIDEYKYINSNRIIDICTIEELASKYGNNNWIKCSEPGKQEKEFCELADLETWTEKGWTKLHRVIRHVLAPHKKMFRILTHTGLVDVTDDHSLILHDGKEISPKDVKMGTKLLHHELPKTGINTLVPLSSVKLVYKFDNMLDAAKCAFNLQNENKIFTVHVEDRVDLSFQLNVNEDVLLMQTDPCLQRLGFYERMKLLQKIKNTKNKLYIISIYSYPIEDYRQNVKDICEICYSGYVYDLTTDNHHFAAGVGNLIVHNTDSVFFTFNLETLDGKPIRGKTALEITIELAQEAGHLASSFLKEPHDLEYEKTFMPFCLLSKKRYVGMLYEHDANKCKRKEMGIVLKRRDNAPIVKDIYGGIIDILMKQQDITKATEFLKTCLKNIVDEKYPMDKLIITKSLRSGYKNPQQIAHKVLSDRITARDPGSKPSSGDRIPFVYIHNSNKKALQGEKIETPTFIREQNLKIDYSFYITNQILKPVQQVFALVLEKIWTIQNKKSKIARFNKEMEIVKRSVEPDKINDKIESMKNKEIKILLFDEFLRETNNQKDGNQALTKFFK